MRPVCLLAVVLVSASVPSLYAQANPSVEPGFPIPANTGALPLVFETIDGKSLLVPVHHSTISLNKHTGANLAGAAIGNVFYKPKMTTELPGKHARTKVQSTSPVFYLHRLQDVDSVADADDAEVVTWVLVHAIPDKDRRVIGVIRYTQLTGNAKREDGFVETISEELTNGWLRLTPKAALDPGEYALTAIPHTKGAYATTVFDFSLDPASSTPSDAMTAPPSQQ